MPILAYFLRMTTHSSRADERGKLRIFLHAAGLLASSRLFASSSPAPLPQRLRYRPPASRPYAAPRMCFINKRKAPNLSEKRNLAPRNPRISAIAACQMCQMCPKYQAVRLCRRRTTPSCATLATSRPSRSKIRPRLKPRPAPLHGLSVA